ncbi:MAG: T9SS type A sorting domain-containing protein, partial [Candidatus Aminicenantes bacterium]|nr:T9SS type A sorting domain-containing protein [Candidatus Aminicenantes bacterium]
TVYIDYGTDNDDETLPGITALGDNYPNPFNPSTTITYSLKEGGQVRIDVYNLRGERLITLVNEVRDAGVYGVEWNGRDEAGRMMPSGIYFYNMKSGKYTSIKKMILMK